MHDTVLGMATTYNVRAGPSPVTGSLSDRRRGLLAQEVAIDLGFPRFRSLRDLAERDAERLGDALAVSGIRLQAVADVADLDL